jgi:hypothetical protein
MASRPNYASLFQRLAMTDARLATRVFRRYVVPRTQQVAALIRRGVREGAFRPVDGTHAAFILTGLIVPYFAAAPMIKTAFRIDPLEPGALRRRKREVLDFVRFGLFCGSEEDHR